MTKEHKSNQRESWEEGLKKLAEEERKNALEKNYAGIWLTFNAHNIEAFIREVEAKAFKAGVEKGKMVITPTMGITN